MSENWYECTHLNIFGHPDEKEKRVEINSSFGLYLDLYQGVV